MTTPATENLFRTKKDTDVEPLSKYRFAHFHSTGAKLLFLAKRGCPDMLLAVSFIMT